MVFVRFDEITKKKYHKPSSVFIFAKQFSFDYLGVFGVWMDYTENLDIKVKAMWI